MANPIEWINPKIVGGGEARTIEIFKRWSTKNEEIETLEPCPSKLFGANYLINEPSARAMPLV